MTSHNQALVFGASGLVGWAIVDQLLSNYPTKGTFSKVTACVNRPLTVADAEWPNTSSYNPELQLVSGVDLTAGSVEEFAASLKEKINGIESVTHVFYLSYTSVMNDPKAEYARNTSMQERAVGAVEQLCPNLAFIAFPGGTKRYGVHKPGGLDLFKAPYKEDVGRLPESLGDDALVIYYAMEDLLESRSRGKKWTWCEVIPDAIIGFAPNGSQYNLTAHWANYLSLYAHMHPGAKLHYPGSVKGYDALNNDCSSDMLARFTIWASLNPDTTGGRLFNIADSATPVSMRQRWPSLCAYFGLEGVEPAEGDVEGDEALLPGKYVEKYSDVLVKAGTKGNPVSGGQNLDYFGFHFTFDRWLDLGQARVAGFYEEKDPGESWLSAFDKFKKAGLIIG